MLGGHASCQRLCGMWGGGGLRGVETCCPRHAAARLPLSHAARKRAVLAGARAMGVGAGLGSQGAYRSFDAPPGFGNKQSMYVCFMSMPVNDTRAAVVLLVRRGGVVYREGERGREGARVFVCGNRARARERESAIERLRTRETAHARARERQQSESLNHHLMLNVTSLSILNDHPLSDVSGPPRQV